ncbi:hypothetical protein KSP40_PGU000348 [Platanthera guangdongensis]|uniref:GPI mannosyltransferase 2 n=1 Tax=Platanthera guangdongensis TaxID=2320717 RepID=A0ABR2MH77_9ASPA
MHSSSSCQPLPRSPVLTERIPCHSSARHPLPPVRYFLAIHPRANPSIILFQFTTEFSRLPIFLISSVHPFLKAHPFLLLALLAPSTLLQSSGESGVVSIVRPTLITPVDRFESPPELPDLVVDSPDESKVVPRTVPVIEGEADNTDDCIDVEEIGYPSDLDEDFSPEESSPLPFVHRASASTVAFGIEIFQGNGSLWPGKHRAFSMTKTRALWPRIGAAIESSVVWDNVYFIRIPECGYEYERPIPYSLSFPFQLPSFCYLYCYGYQAVFAPLIPVVGYRAVLALSGYVLNNLAFVLVAIYFYKYRLALLVLKSSLAHRDAGRPSLPG